MRNRIRKLEAEFAARFGFAGAVAAGFGRSALAIALQAAAPDLHPGEHVLLPDFICKQVVEAVRQAGAAPVFFPVRRDLTVQTAVFRSAFTSQTRAAVAAHYFGSVQTNIAELAAVCRERGVPLIEDCALALGARREAQSAGTFGDLAVFSFTKSDWCFGGGLVATRSPVLLSRLRELAPTRLQRNDRLCLQYGFLRRADWLANRPRHSAAAERAGRWLERWFAPGQENFFDGGLYDVAMPDFAARRAQQVLWRLADMTQRRRRLLKSLRAGLPPPVHVFKRSQEHPGGDSSAAFLLLCAPRGDAWQWRERAAEAGVTLRLMWPAYQQLDPAQQSAELDWMARHLLCLEIHPELRPAEVGRIVAVVRHLFYEEDRMR